MTESKRPEQTREGEANSSAKAFNLPADAQIIAQIRAGDPSALTALFEAYYVALVRFAYYLLGSRDAAKDVAQEVFVHLWEQPEAFTHARSLKQYLYAAVRNRALNERKRESVRVRHQEATRAAVADDPLIGGVPSPENAVLSEATVQAAMAKLSERRQEVVRLHLKDQLTTAEIGQILGISPGAAERLIFRALGELRKILRVSV